jgi:ribosome-associated protein
VQTIATGKIRPGDIETLKALIEDSLDADKAVEIVEIDLRGKTSIADYMIIASGQSHRQVGAMTDHIRRRLKDAGVRGISVEGEGHCDWVLIDAGDILVHLFRPEVRDFYKLEKLWGDAAAPNMGQTGSAAR